MEDWIGAGAIIAHLHGGLSPEAQAALAASRSAEQSLESHIRQCGSGKELIARGQEEDVGLACARNIGAYVPRLVNGAYVREEP